MGIRLSFLYFFLSFFSSSWSRSRVESTIEVKWTSEASMINASSSSSLLDVWLLWLIKTFLVVKFRPLTRRRKAAKILSFFLKKLKFIIQNLFCSPLIHHSLDNFLIFLFVFFFICLQLFPLLAFSFLFSYVSQYCLECFSLLTIFISYIFFSFLLNIALKLKNQFMKAATFWKNIKKHIFFFSSLWLFTFNVFFMSLEYFRVDFELPCSAARKRERYFERWSFQ